MSVEEFLRQHTQSPLGVSEVQDHSRRSTAGHSAGAHQDDSWHQWSPDCAECMTHCTPLTHQASHAPRHATVCTASIQNDNISLALSPAKIDESWESPAFCVSTFSPSRHWVWSRRTCRRQLKAEMIECHYQCHHAVYFDSRRHSQQHSPQDIPSWVNYDEPHSAAAACSCICLLNPGRVLAGHGLPLVCGLGYYYYYLFDIPQIYKNKQTSMNSRQKWHERPT